MRRAAGLTLAAAAVLLLSACAAGERAMQDSRPAAEAPDVAAADSVQRRRAAPDSDALAARTPADRAPEPPESRDPDGLVGLGPDEVATLLGEPSFVRRDPPAEFWRYRHAECVLELFLYARDGAPRVTHVETRNAAAITLSPGQCLGTLIAERRKAKG